jgi:membrane-bound lytic murein transglycosylase B
VAIAQASRGLYSRSAAQVLARLRSAGPALRAPASSPATRAQAARLEQLAYAQLVAHPEWQPQVLPQLPADLREAADANVSAGTELAAMGGDPSERLPHWAVSAPAPAPQLMAYYHEAEAAFGVGWHYLAAINLVETAMGRIRGLSYAGAAGPMQFMPETWASFGLGDINNPRDSILAAGRYLKARGAPADMDKAIYSYNLDHHYVRAVKTYAARILTDPSAYTGYYNWQVYISTVAGPALLPEGWTN